MTFRLGPLVVHHDLTVFTCGNPELDDWLRHHARTATGQGTRTYVHHEFEPMPTNPRRFTRKLSTIARAIGKPWP